MSDWTVELDPGQEIVIKSDGLPSLRLSKEPNGQIHIVFDKENGIFDPGERYGKYCVRVHSADNYCLRVDEVFGKTADGPVIMKMKNPDSLGGYLEWPDGSMFYVSLDEANTVLSEEQVKQFRRWYYQEYTGK